MDSELDQALDDPASPAVMARRFADPADAAELAAWSGAELLEVTGTGAEGETEVHPVLEVPTARGPLPAVEGDWVVRIGEDRFLPVTAEDFAARFEPLEP